MSVKEPSLPTRMRMLKERDTHALIWVKQICGGPLRWTFSGAQPVVWAAIKGFQMIYCFGDSLSFPSHLWLWVKCLNYYWMELVQKFTSPFGINYKQSADPKTFNQTGHFFFQFFALWIKTPANDISRIDKLISQCTWKLTWWKCQILHLLSICISASFHCRNTGWSNTLKAREKKHLQGSIVCFMKLR